jgi:hypothetical protein
MVKHVKQIAVTKPTCKKTVTNAVTEYSRLPYTECPLYGCTRNTKQQKNSNTSHSHVARLRTEKSSGKRDKPPEASFCDLLTQLEIALA